ncbi:MAG: hypothetical protein JOZ22_13690, partial [Acidobacteriia bacterium]|nr:hypothetical protein [Terriglobia bacterium]
RIWRKPSPGEGPEELVFPDLPQGMWADWAVGRAGIYFVLPDKTDVSHNPAGIEFVAWSDKRPQQVGQTSKAPTEGGFSVDAAGQTFLYTQLDQTGTNILLLERN